jgi:hypothetical protein
MGHNSVFDAIDRKVDAEVADLSRLLREFRERQAKQCPYCGADDVKVLCAYPAQPPDTCLRRTKPSASQPQP